eukprot:6469386-Amphidinium_carterae.6
MDFPSISCLYGTHRTDKDSKGLENVTFDGNITSLVLITVHHHLNPSVLPTASSDHDREAGAQHLAFIHGVACEHQCMSITTDIAQHIPQEATRADVNAKPLFDCHPTIAQNFMFASQFARSKEGEVVACVLAPPTTAAT